jgi:DNA repair protein SbcD/Mre11
MKFLHTSDWHLGRALYGRKRYEEFSAFLDWLVQTITTEQIDVLLVAGDIFDTRTPSNQAQELYYRFLCTVAASCCRHVVVIAGNHDSPSFLDAPKELLRVLNVYVVGAMTANIEDEVIVLQKSPSSVTAHSVEAIICAVPYLRDKDIRTVEPGETIDDKNKKLSDGIKQHYHAVVAHAERIRHALLQSSTPADRYIPLIAMGHLFVTGGKTVDGDGVRELYVGTLAQVNTEIFPTSVDYVALGHLHVPQTVGNTEHIRYCGSPIPIGFGEATQEKSVLIVDFSPNAPPQIHKTPVPRFQPLLRVVGSLADILSRLEILKQEHSTAWIEIEYTGRDFVSNLREQCEAIIADSAMDIRKVSTPRTTDRLITILAENETLDDLSLDEIFTRCLDAHHIPDDAREDLMMAYHSIIQELQEEDRNAV